jgi:hypothetical protein
VELQLLTILHTATDDPQAGVVQLETFIATYDAFKSDNNSVDCVNFAKSQIKQFKLKANQADQKATQLEKNYRDEINRIVATALQLAPAREQEALHMLRSAKALFSQHNFLNDDLHVIDDAIEQLTKIQ